MTFDGKHYEYTGLCPYTLFEIDDVTITIQNQPCAFGAICYKQVDIKVGTMSISLVRDMPLIIGSLVIDDFEYRYH